MSRDDVSAGEPCPHDCPGVLALDHLTHYEVVCPVCGRVVKK